VTKNRQFGRIARGSGRAAHVEIAADRALVLNDAPWLGGVATGEELQSWASLLVAPVDPSKIICVGRNYAAHAKELGNDVPAEPMLFYKPPSSLVGPNDAVILPPPDVSERIEHEAELAVVVGRRLRRADESEAASAVFGLTVACDVTARDLQKKDGQWWRAKGMDTFCPVGPLVVTGVDASDLRVRCWVGDELRQDGRTSSMIFSIPRVLAHVSRVITLEPGDLVLTGTPEGVGPIRAGNRLRIEIEDVGELSVEVRAGEVQ
jgi:2-keto-4-pentenoate hydratase/2-oxohepta-3-ene-1,7-dioic acid hydratase in catechol pathway